MKPKIVIANWVHLEVRDYLERHGTVLANVTRDPWPRRELIEHCRDAEALVAFMPESVDEAFLTACPNLRVVACALKGFDNFDVAACTRHGVFLTIVPDLLTAPTAELCIGLMIALCRNIMPGDALVRSGTFSGWRPQLYGRSIDGSTVGILGAGAIGKAIAQRLTGFSCRMIYHDAHGLSAAEEERLRLRLRRVTLADLQVQSDFLILALPLTGETMGLVDTEFLSRMKGGACLVNPARGSLVDEAAVADALEVGRLGGYAADVFACEDWARADRPLVINPRLLAAGNTVLTPHLGSAVDAVRREIAFEAARNLVQCLRGEHPVGAVNDVLSPIEGSERC